jgi:hypothetical protein
MPYRSKLIPFEAEIADLRRKRPPTPYSEIVRLLKDGHDLTVQVSTLFNFVKVRRKWGRLQSLPPQPLPSAVARSASTQPMSEIQRDRSTIRARATPARPVEPSPRSGKVALPHEKPGGRTLKSFTPSSEYNLERLTPEQMAEWLAELKREQGG